MKRCPFCAEEIQDAAIVCKHCQRDLKASSGKKTSPLAMGGAIVVGFFILVTLIGIFNRATPSGGGTVNTARQGPQTPPLALLSSRGYESTSGGYHYVEGQVKNLSAESLSRVAAQVTWFTRDDQFITSDDALIDFDPLLPGQTSSFKTITRSNPAMSRYSVEFKRILGGAIPFRDDRNATPPRSPAPEPRQSSSAAAPEPSPPPKRPPSSWGGEPSPPPGLAVKIERVADGWQISNLSLSYTWRGCVVRLESKNIAKLPDVGPLATVVVRYSDFPEQDEAAAAKSAPWVSCKAGGQTYTTAGN
jgi:hypothetical protein